MPDAAKTAAAVRIEVSGALSRLASARESAEAHCALGGSMADVAERLAHQEAAVNDVLALLRRLHVAANAVHTDRTDVAWVEESIHKLEADREVAALHARARAATRPREQR